VEIDIMQRVAFVILALAATSFSTPVVAAEPAEFARTTIDLGMVTSDIDKAVKFYTEALGFREAPGFNVAAEFCTDAGLTDNQPLAIRVLVLGEGESATKLKLMQIPGAKSKPNDTSFLHSQLGMRYMTVFVADATATAERLAKAGVKPLGKGPMPLPPGFPKELVISVVRDPDGNMVELIGPKK